MSLLPIKKKAVADVIHVYVDGMNMGLSLYEYYKDVVIDWRLFVEQLLSCGESVEFFFFGAILDPEYDPDKLAFVKKFYAGFREIFNWREEFKGRLEVHFYEKPVEKVYNRKNGKVVDFKCDADGELMLDAYEAVIKGKANGGVILMSGDRDFIPLMKRIKYKHKIRIKWIPVSESTSRAIRREFPPDEINYLVEMAVPKNVPATAVVS